MLFYLPSFNQNEVGLISFADFPLFLKMSFIVKRNEDIYELNISERFPFVHEDITQCYLGFFESKNNHEVKGTDGTVALFRIKLLRDLHCTLQTSKILQIQDENVKSLKCDLNRLFQEEFISKLLLLENVSKVDVDYTSKFLSSFKFRKVTTLDSNFIKETFDIDDEPFTRIDIKIELMCTENEKLPLIVKELSEYHTDLFSCFQLEQSFIFVDNNSEVFTDYFKFGEKSKKCWCILNLTETYMSILFYSNRISKLEKTEFLKSIYEGLIKIQNRTNQFILLKTLNLTHKAS